MQKSVLLGALIVAALANGQQPSTKNGEWPHYTADLKGTKYSPLDQINASNFNTLKLAWRFHTENLGPKPEYNMEDTPLMVNGVVYTTAGARRDVVALDAQPALWVFFQIRGPKWVSRSSTLAPTDDELVLEIEVGQSRGSQHT